jgi:nucleotide-binding universal stress UspA family protein
MGTLDPVDTPRPCILVAIDFSPTSDNALQVAADLAEAMKLPLVLLHVVHDPANAPGRYSVADDGEHKVRKKDKKRWEKRARTIRDAAEDMLRGYLDARRAAAPDREVLARATPVLVVGTPAPRIVEVAAEHGAKMIVMGTRGRSALSGILLGSNANRVVHLSTIPVTLVKSGADGSAKPAEGE